MESNFVLCCPEPEITSGLSDIYALRGKPNELEVKMNMDCDGAWFKDGEQVKPMNYYTHNTQYVHFTIR